MVYKVLIGLGFLSRKFYLIFFLDCFQLLEYLKLFLFFQVKDVDYFTWTDRQGVKHPLMPTNSTCDLKNPAWESNQREVNDINQLPITNIKYGPMQFESAKVKIVVGPIVCQPSENALLVREQMVADRIEALNVSLF